MDVNDSKHLVVLAVALCAAFFSGCGGGGGGGGGLDIGTAGVADGTITGFGSVYVNGVRYVSSSASFDVDDNPAGEDDLRVGMRVRVNGMTNAAGTEGTATSFEFDQDLEGPIASIDTSSSSLVVLGRTVIVDAGTVIKDESGSRAADDSSPQLTLADLSVDEFVEVSGLFGVNDDIIATRIERKSSTFVGGSTIVEVKGIVSSLSGNDFSIGSLAIDGSGATIEGVLLNGVPVEVKGTLASSGTTTLVATSIEVEDHDHGASNGQKLELEGIVTSLTSQTTFVVGTQEVVATAASFENGAVDDIAVGVRLEVEGFMAGTTLIATEVEFRGNRVKLEGTLTAASASSVTIFGLTVQINGATEINGGPLASSDEVQLRGYLANSTIVATEIEKTSVSEEIIQGTVDGGSISGTTSFDILGITIDTTGVSESDFEGLNDAIIGRSQFFASLSDGTMVKAVGTFSGGTLTATEVELED